MFMSLRLDFMYIARIRSLLGGLTSATTTFHHARVILAVSEQKVVDLRLVLG